MTTLCRHRACEGMCAVRTMGASIPLLHVGLIAALQVQPWVVTIDMVVS